MAGSLGTGVFISHLHSHSDFGTCLRTWEIYFCKRQRFSGVQEQEAPDKSIVSGFLVAQPMLGMLMRPDAAFVHNPLPTTSPHSRIKTFPSSSECVTS